MVSGTRLVKDCVWRLLSAPYGVQSEHQADDISERHFWPSHATPLTELAATRTSYY